jgi:hypothetical protein
MNRDGHNDVSFFIGTEVEHTLAFGLRTLFVVAFRIHRLFYKNLPTTIANTSTLVPIKVFLR